MSFDNLEVIDQQEFDSLNPFRAGQCLSTQRTRYSTNWYCYVSIPFEQGNVFRPEGLESYATEWKVSIPFEQGNVFRQKVQKAKTLQLRVSIPFEQGNVFRLRREEEFTKFVASLNPFRAGQCLSTAAVCWRQESCGLLDPLPNFLEG